MVLGERRFGVEGVDLGRAAVGEDMDDAFGLRGKVRRAWGEGVVEVDGADAGGGFGEEVGAGEGGEAEGAEADPTAMEEITAGEEMILEARGVVGHARGRRRGTGRVTAWAKRGATVSEIERTRVAWESSECREGNRVVKKCGLRKFLLAHARGDDHTRGKVARMKRSHNNPK